MSGELPEGNVRPKERDLNAGVVPVGLPQSTMLQIKNYGTRDTAFRFHANDQVRPRPVRSSKAN